MSSVGVGESVVQRARLRIDRRMPQATFSTDDPSVKASGSRARPSLPLAPGLSFILGSGDDGNDAA